MQGKAEHCATTCGDMSIGVDRIELREQLDGALECTCGWHIEKIEIFRIDAPGCEFKRDSCQVDLENFGFNLLAPRTVFCLRPQSIRAAGAEAPG